MSMMILQQIQNEIHQTIVNNQLFKKGRQSKVGRIVFNDFGLQIIIWMDNGVNCSSDRQKNNYTCCGVFRRQALQRRAVKLGCNKIITGHNADNIAETVVMNMLRGNPYSLDGCSNAIFGQDEAPLSNLEQSLLNILIKINCDACYYKKLNYFSSTQCVYSLFAYRGHVRQLIKQLENKRPQSILDIICSGKAAYKQVKLLKLWFYDKQQDSKNISTTIRFEQGKKQDKPKIVMQIQNNKKSYYNKQKIWKRKKEKMKNKQQEKMKNQQKLTLK